MIFVQSPLKRDYIKELIDGQTIDGATFTFVKIEGMKIYFSVDGVDPEKGAAIAKSVVKKSDLGSALYFTVGVN